jgi:hypothetical protein
MLLAVSPARADWTAILLGQPGEFLSQVNAVTATMQGGEYASAPPSVIDAAGFWTGSGASWTPLFASPTTTGAVYGMDGDTQVGYAGARAALWHGTPESRVDLGPPGGITTTAFAVRGNMQVGQMIVNPANVSHAVMWTGTAASMVDLSPPGMPSCANATDGTLQGGIVQTATGDHATLWNGSAASLMDLNPAGAHTSVINGMVPGVQVGYITSDSFVGRHAGMWNGSAGSFVDLSPPGSSGYTALYATTGSISVGEWAQNGLGRAAINFGTPDSWLGLHQFLPPGFSFSHASSVYQDGNTIYVGGWAFSNANGENEAVLWIGTVPAPGSAAVLLGAGLFAARRRRP